MTSRADMSREQLLALVEELEAQVAERDRQMAKMVLGPIEGEQVERFARELGELLAELRKVTGHCAARADEEAV